MDEKVGQLHAWVDAHADEIVEALRGVLRIPSTKDAPGENAPYGPAVRRALDYTLDLSKNLGFAVKDVDGHAGHAEFGEGTEMICAVGHLDVVPAGDGWRHDPFGAEIEDGFIYARGASDDKGPTYASLFAAKALMDSGLPLSRRVRVVFGCDEESGFGCVRYYWQTAKEEMPVLSFTPDAYFPGVYAEKGSSTFVLEHTAPASPDGARIAWMRGGRRLNMVPDACEARIEGPKDQLYTLVVALANYFDRNVTTTPDPSGITVLAAGKSGHASRPQSGDNAIGRLARALATLDLPERRWLAFLARSADGAGAGLGIDGRDDVAGPLTCNLGMFTYEEGVARASYNTRYPVTWTIEDLLSRLAPTIENSGWTLARHSNMPPLHVPIDQEPVKTLLAVWREESGDADAMPGTMGGRTYASAIPNAIAFGAVFPDSPDGPAHEPDERMRISNLIRATKIYAHALYELAK